MRPRNDREREVVRLYRQLPPLTKPQREWIVDSVVGVEIFTSGRSCWCSKCGGSWKEKIGGTEAVCPHCGARGSVHYGRHTTRRGNEYVQFLQVYKGWQVIKYLFIRWDCKKGRKQLIYDMNVLQMWCQPGRPMITLGAQLCYLPYWRTNPYSLWTDKLVIRHPSYFYSEWMITSAYPRQSLLPVYVKNLGKKPDFSQIDAPTLLGDIFGNPYLESLYKAGETKKLKYLLDYVSSINKFWPSIRVALRHGYEPDHWPSYFEHLRALKYLHYDMRSPRYVAPPDFGQLHDLIMRQYRNKVERAQQRRNEAMALRYAIEEEERARQMEQMAKENAETFAKRIAKFADLKIEDDDIVITPLMTIEAFKDEGAAMHHCVFTGSYYKKPESLILSARTRTENERVETIEVSLRDWTILQSRGIYNDFTDRHDEILGLVTQNMGTIQELAVSRSRS